MPDISMSVTAIVTVAILISASLLRWIDLYSDLSKLDEVSAADKCFPERQAICVRWGSARYPVDKLSRLSKRSEFEPSSERALHYSCDRRARRLTLKHFPTAAW